MPDDVNEHIHIQLIESRCEWLAFQRKWVIEMTMDVNRIYECLWVVFSFMKFVSEDNRKRVRQMDDLLHNKGQFTHTYASTHVIWKQFHTDTTVFWIQ